MTWRWLSWAGTGLVGFATVTAAVAQSERPWVDPPRPSEPARPSPAVPNGPIAPAAPQKPQVPESPRVAAPPTPAAPAPSQPDARQQVTRPAAREVEPAKPISPPAVATPADESQRRAAPARPVPERADTPPSRGVPAPNGAQAKAAQQFAIDYLAFWSGADATALETVPAYYAPNVIFHGQQRSARSILDEKRRFVRRWPHREYRPRTESIQTSCDPSPPICTVRTVFDFTASSRRGGRRSQGVGILQLGISFASGDPRIVFESSQVTSRGPSGRDDYIADEDDEQD